MNEVVSELSFRTCFGILCFDFKENLETGPDESGQVNRISRIKQP